MAHLDRSDLLTLEAYSRQREAFRENVMAHKRDRQISLGDHVRLLFEDKLTIQYQIQEMLRAEKIFEADGIQEELDSYNPLIPDGDNWKATMMIEYTDVEERKRELARLIGIEDRVWARVEGQDKVYAIADEDMDRETQEKTSSVHFLRFQLPEAFVAAVKAGKALAFGVDHSEYNVARDPVSEPCRASLAADLE